MKYVVLFFSFCMMAGCSDAFINHSLAFEKRGACNANSSPVKVLSNINGERYEFEYCLGENFSKKDYNITRSGDSLQVTFPEASGNSSNYKLILDVDAKPAYRFITLGTGGQTIAISPKKL
ncbi:MAG: hypothetical protein EOO06_15470 [Chitinophagaceae bacterium]|nr:MAG: hypothetical protein EOO06_15470 [Chitinophagaceae bacterium]